MTARTRFLLGAATCAALLTTACSDTVTRPSQAAPSSPRTSGGSGSGGGGISGGGGGTAGGGGSTAPTTGVVSYSNFGPTDVVSTFIGWGLVGTLTTPAGFFSDVAERFSPTVSGSIATIRLALQQTGTGGNGSYTLYLYADNATPPDTSVCWPGACEGTTIGTLIGTFQGKTTKQVFAATTAVLSAISVSNGPRLQAGVNYWFKVVPSSQTRLTWYLNPLGVVGEEFYEDPYTPQLYSMDSGGSQGAFEVRVSP